MDPNFDRPVFPKFEAPWVEDLPDTLETCRGGPRPIRLCAEKTKNFRQIQPPRTWRPKWTQIWSARFPQIWSPLSRGPALHAWNLQGNFLGLLGCVLKRLKILVKFKHRLPGGQNGPKFWFAHFPQIWSPLSRGPALHAWNLQPPWTWRPKWTQILIGPFSPNLKNLE